MRPCWYVRSGCRQFGSYQKRASANSSLVTPCRRLSGLQTYLPTRYWAEKAHVVDRLDRFSQQIDVVIYAGQKVIPAESVYAVFEAKQ